MREAFLVDGTTTAADTPAAGLPDPLRCKRGFADYGRQLADRVDAEVGGATSYGGAGYVPGHVESED